ncbi:hypothetical protein NMY22_g13674 [Coprinellus aureogranulatus]|nr:hypothetical protein NMY22_g13674 [Coprinellus aureogranulatus]
MEEGRLSRGDGGSVGVTAGDVESFPAKQETITRPYPQLAGGIVDAFSYDVYKASIQASSSRIRILVRLVAGACTQDARCSTKTVKLIASAPADNKHGNSLFAEIRLG